MELVFIGQEEKVSHTDPLLKLRAGVDLDALGPGLGGGDGLWWKAGPQTRTVLSSDAEASTWW